ncbi:MAG: Cysteine desulfurase [bacterium ADurb.Bin429]|nr:MAG: Cysteine desulfurase [bacterium ADurb.Bin429]
MNPFARHVYLDHNATTPICRAAQQSMRRVERRFFGNPSALYRTGHMAREILEESRAAVARALGVGPTEIIFTGCASEANNQVLTMLFERCYPNRRTLIVSPIEHPSVIATARYLEARGAELRWMRTGPTGIVDMDHYATLLDESVFLVSCMLANNETGTVQDIARMAAMAHESGILFHSDCVQALGKVPLDLKSLGVDYASFSAHKINGPKGIGALYAAPIGGAGA